MIEPEWTDLRDGRRALLRQAIPSDAEALIDHVNRVGAERVYLVTERVMRSVEEERETLRAADGRSAVFLVAELEGALVASANFARGLQAKNAHTASLGVAVRAEARGLGIGTALMHAGIRWARSVGVRKLTLGVFATNERALRLYRTFGFVEEGRLRGQVILDGLPVDEILMALWI